MPRKITRKKKDYTVHPTAIIEDNVTIGSGSKVWHYAQIRRGTKIGKNCIVGKSVFVDIDSEIGDNVKIQNHALIYHKAIISDGVFIGPNVCFTNDKLPRAINPDGTLKSAEDWEGSTIKIAQGASIGGHSVILPGVSIGEFALTGSGSVISKNVPAFGLVYGNPARLKGFVCRCGKKILSYSEVENKIIGKCTCCINIDVDKFSYESLQGEKPKKKIWLR